MMRTASSGIPALKRGEEGSNLSLTPVTAAQFELHVRRQVADPKTSNTVVNLLMHIKLK
jgi:hypothetical protein